MLMAALVPRAMLNAHMAHWEVMWANLRTKRVGERLKHAEGSASAGLSPFTPAFFLA